MTLADRVDYSELAGLRFCIALPASSADLPHLLDLLIFLSADFSLSSLDKCLYDVKTKSVRDWSLSGSADDSRNSWLFVALIHRNFLFPCYRSLEYLGEAMLLCYVSRR